MQTRTAPGADIAAAAGVTHALVHRYFGTKEEMVAEILRREIGSAIAITPPAECPTTNAFSAPTTSRTAIRSSARSEIV